MAMKTIQFLNSTDHEVKVIMVRIGKEFIVALLRYPFPGQRVYPIINVTLCWKMTNWQQVYIAYNIHNVLTTKWNALSVNVYISTNARVSANLCVSNILKILHLFCLQTYVKYLWGSLFCLCSVLWYKICVICAMMLSFVFILPLL